MCSRGTNIYWIEKRIMGNLCCLEFLMLHAFYTRNITLCIFQWHDNWRIISIKKFLHCPLSCFMYCNQSIWSIVTFTWRYNCCQILSSFFVLKWIICGLTIFFLYYHSVLPKPKSWHLIPYQIIRTLKKKKSIFSLAFEFVDKNTKHK